MIPSTGWWLVLLSAVVWIGTIQTRRVALKPRAGIEATYTIDINRATEFDLLNLPDVGPSLVRSILKYREEHGEFQRLEDFANIPGVGPQTFEQLAPYLRISSTAELVSDEAILTAQRRERIVP